MTEQFGGLLRRMRRMRALTQEELAGASGLSVEGISLLERGIRQNPRMSTVELLVKAFNLSQEEADTFRTAATAEGGEPQDAETAGRPGRGGDRSSDSYPPTGERMPTVAFRRAQELPASPTVLFGRQHEVDHLLEVMAAKPHAVALVGLGGVGKTAMALRIAERAADTFPGGVIYLNLRGTDQHERLDPVAALRALMASLGEDPYTLPRDEDRASAAWRSAVAGRRILLVLDDVASLRQAAALFPGAESTVLMTSRRDLASSPREIVQHQVEPLAQSNAREMLRSLAANRTAEETDALNELADRCHGLPLALRMVAARLTSRSRWPANYLVERIEASGGDLLDLEIGDLSLRNTLVTSIEELQNSSDPVDVQAAELFLALGLIPGGAVSLTVAGCLVGLTSTRVEYPIERLVEVSLLDPGDRPGTYRTHNVLRQVARDLADRTMRPDEIERVRKRLLTLFTALAWKSRDLSRPAPDSIDHAALVAACPPGWDRSRCLTEIKDHADLWQAISRSAPANASYLRDGVVHLTLGLITYFVAVADTAGWPDQLVAALALVDNQNSVEAAWLHQDLTIALSGVGDYQAAVDTGERACDLANSLDDPACLGWAKTALSLALFRAGRADDARHESEAVLRLAAEIQDLHLEATAWRDLSVLHTAADRMNDAVDAAERSLELYQQVGSPRGIVMAQVNLGVAWRETGRFEQSLKVFEQAVAGARAIQDRALTTEALDELGQWHSLQGHAEQAIDVLHQSLELVDVHGGRQWEARIRVRLAQACEVLGRAEEAKTHWSAAAQVHLERGEWREASTAARAADDSRRLHLVRDQSEGVQSSSG